MKVKNAGWNEGQILEEPVWVAKMEAKLKRTEVHCRHNLIFVSFSRKKLKLNLYETRINCSENALCLHSWNRVIKKHHQHNSLA